MAQWNELESHFECDGSLRDIYVFETDDIVWNKFLTEIRLSKYPIEFSYGENLVELPLNIESIRTLQENDPTKLLICVNDIKVHCHFFINSEIEMDITPKDIQSNTSFNYLVEFLEWLSNTLQSKVLLTHENSEDNVIMTVFP